MLFVSQVRRTLPFAALALAAALAACSEPPAPVAPAAPPPPPPVALSAKVIEQASAYRAYVQRAGAISPGFTDGTSVAQSLKTGASYEPQQLMRGAIAYGAVIAMQDREYIAGARKYASDPAQRRAVAYEIMKDPAYVIGISGSAGAAGLVVAALGEDGGRLYEQGKLVKQAAYDVQRSAWSKADVARRDARLAEAKQLSVTPVLGDVGETARLQQAALGGGSPGLTPQPASPPYSPVVVRSLAVAALAALGYADDTSLEQVMPILAEPGSTACFNMSKLNLYQCLAVAKPHYEDVFCLGQHVLMDTGKCLIKGAGLPAPVEIKPAALTVADTPSTAAKSRKPAAKGSKKR